MKRVGQIWDVAYTWGAGGRQLRRRWLIVEDRSPSIESHGWHMNYLGVDLLTGLVLPLEEPSRGWEDHPDWERVA